MLRRYLGDRNFEADARDVAVELKRRGHRSGSPLDNWNLQGPLHWGGRGAVTDHFMGTALDTAWAWAGAPFATPGTVGVADSVLTVLNVGTARSFLYQTIISTGYKRAAVSLLSDTVGFAVGMRLDDGSDNNYVEEVLQVSAANPTNWAVQGRARTGGGVVATVAGDDMCVPLGYILDMILFGTRWSAWGARMGLTTAGAFGGVMFKPFTALGGALAWTPTRVGLVFDNLVGGASWESGLVDWCEIY